MSVKNLFNKNKQLQTTAKFLRKTSLELSGSGIESQEDLKEKIKKQDQFVPFIDYSDPANFAKFGSAEKYYSNAFDYISNYYPYDGSGFEKTKFYNEFNPLEKYIFDERYSKSTGYIIIGNSYGTASGSLSGTTSDSGYFSSSAEYLEVKGGPHLNTVYSSGSNRRSNLEFGGLSGSTIEFLFKKDTGIPSASVSSPHTPIQSENQVVFDLYNGATTGSAGYGRLRVEIRSGSEDRFYVTMQSGTNVAFLSASVPTTGGLSLTGSWKHYAFAFNPAGSSSYDDGAPPSLDFYVNGVLHESNIISSGSTPHTTTTFSRIGRVTGTLIANLGSLRTAPSGTVDSTEPSRLGWGKLSASIDEFRFWKATRNSKDIGRYWFDHVNGGTDKYDANSDLGVYFKFNEGVTNITATDEIFLDYSGRVSNGFFRGFETYTRNTSSAINEMSLTSIQEPKDPIVRGTNPLLISTKNSLTTDGREYDYSNTAYVMKTMPSWIWEQDYNSGEELSSLSQIMASYFDTLHSQITVMNEVRDISYISGTLTGSLNEFTHNEKLLSSNGFDTPELFENIDAFEKFFSRDESFSFDQDIEQVKNVIYKNIYNNLQDIMKGKGNEKAIRNLIRCFGVGDDVVSLKTYSNNNQFDLLTNYSPIVSDKKYADFSGLEDRTSSEATVYQYYDSSVTSSVGFISGSDRLKSYAMTAQGEFIFPDYQHAYLMDHVPHTMISSSLFGFHIPSSTELTSTDTTVTASAADHGLQVYAVREPSEYSEIMEPATSVKDVKFVVENSRGDVVLTSSIFQNVYENTKWNLALFVFNDLYPQSLEVSGTGLQTYTLGMYGTNYDSDLKRNSFYATSSLSQLSGWGVLTGSKRFYVGSHRTNFTGALLTRSDIKASSLRVWNSLIPTGTIDIHALDSETYGPLYPYRQAYTFQGITSGSSTKPQNFIPMIETLALNWDFANITGSDASGRFNVSDFSSGSIDKEYIGSYQGVEFSQINKRQMTGRGDFFPASTNNVAKKEFMPSLRKQFPENLFSSDMVSVSPGGDVQAFKPQQRPTNFYFSLEKSLYSSLSNRMLQFFASLEEFNNLIGDPVNKYRPNYKSMEKLREIFFRRVGSDIDFDKYVRYYKWIDDSIGAIVEKLYPASANFRPGIKTIIESHVLERPKIRYVYAGDRTQRRETAKPLEAQPSQANSTSNNTYTAAGASTRERGAPVGAQIAATTATERNEQQRENPWFWKTKVTSSNPVITSGDENIDKQRDKIRQTVLSSSQPARIGRIDVEIGGIRRGNSTKKTSEMSYTKTTPAQNIQSTLIMDLNSFVPKQTEKFNKLPDRKILMPFAVTNVHRTNMSLTGPKVEGKLFAPFTAYSSSIKTGYKAKLSSSGIPNTDFNDMHHDGYGDFGNRTPMQGPFTQDHVGGRMSRHNKPLSITTTSQATTLRKEYFEWNFQVDSVASCQLMISAVTNPETDLDGKTLTLTLGGVSYSATFTDTLTPVNSTKTQIGVRGATTPANGATAIKNSLDLAASADGLPITTSIGLSTNIVTVSGTTIGTTDNGTVFAGNAISGGIIPSSLAVFSGGSSNRAAIADNSISQLDRSLESFSGQYNNPAGRYLRGAKRPLNITNIRSVTGSAVSTEGVKIVGNYTRNYEVVAGSDRSKTNMDFAFHSDQYYTGKIPSPFVVPPSQREKNLSGSVDFFNRRQQAGIRTNKTIIVSRFSAPGSKLDSKQQFRDIASDQMSPNNALPFRNVPVRQNLQSQLRTYVGWGGFKNGNVTGSLDSANLQLFNNGSGSHASIHKTQRNTTTQVRAVRQSYYDSGPPLQLIELETLSTGSIRDNGFISRPIPSADRNTWFMALSGSGMTGSYIRSKLFDQYFVSGSRYPKNIDVPESPDITLLLPSIYGAAGGTVFNARKTYGGKFIFPWASAGRSAPWSQTRVSQTRRGKNYKNIYQFAPTTTDLSRDEQGDTFIYSTKTDLVKVNAAGSSFTSEVLIDKYSRRFVEPPVTSRYKPLVHKVMAYGGTPSFTDDDSKEVGQDVLIEYAYGNNLQGFANKKINQLLGKGKRYSSGLVKRPYEILRDQYVNQTNDGITGIKRVDLMVYEEAIYPREIYTYLSGTRARLSFANNFWRPDFQSQPPPGNRFIPSKSDISNDGFGIGVYNLTGSSVLVSGSTLIERYSLNLKRIRSPFVTSQGHSIEAREQYPEFAPNGIYAPVGQPGSGSIWPMDSTLWREYLHSDNSFFGMAEITTGPPVIMGTTAAGELMLPWHGRFTTDLTGNYISHTGSESGNFYSTSSLVSAQYVYTVPAETEQHAAPANTHTTFKHPGGIFSRPSWTAGRERKFVDGDNKGQAAPGKYPFESTYEDYIKDLRFVAKDHTIIPEFRISELMEDYKSKGKVTIAATSSLSLTGAAGDAQDSSNSDFINRYSTTDFMQYLEPFMRKKSDDLQFNKPPRHLSLESSAYIKLLPYNQFYPQTRVVELARLMSQSYGGFVSSSCNDEKAIGRTKWRPLLRPFFAPGIMLNSIKSGLGVQYPISRDGFNHQQFYSGSMRDVMPGGLSSSLDFLVVNISGTIPGNRRRRQTLQSGNFDFNNTDVNKFFYADVVPFEGILKPLEYVNSTLPGIMSTDVNPRLYRDLTASILPEASQNDLLYRLATSNFLAATPEFFLKKKKDGGHLTKFVAEIPIKNSTTTPQGVAAASQEDARKVEVKANSAYVMEIGLRKTDNFNLYSNPYAFGPPTATGSYDWVGGATSIAQRATDDGLTVYATTSSAGVLPKYPNWPLHRAEFAPFTPTYYYGPSLVRITYMPEEDKDVTLNEILRGNETYVEFVNSNGHHYDWASGSFVGKDGNTINSGGLGPAYGWNRAWQNRQDIDASIVIDNIYPTEGAEVSPLDSNKWVIMPKWECPILDFPRRKFNYPLQEELLTGDYNFSQSIDVGKVGAYEAQPHTGSTIGMWHQYGLMPNQNEGVYLYISDVTINSTEQRLCGTEQEANRLNLGKVMTVKKIPRFVANSGRQISSLARLVGFKDEEIMPADQFLPEKAKRIGEIADDGEKTISEGIIAIPYYLDGETKTLKSITLKSDGQRLGPKLKEFRRAFTKYSLPPSLRGELLGLLPPNYPERSDFINPFGTDDYEEVLNGADILQTPVIYLFEHTVELSRQDLSDIWQGILPDVGSSMKQSFVSIDHYMPGDSTEGGKRTVFPELMEQELSLGLPRDGHPRVDLLDIAGKGDKNGFHPEIRWLVFRVKQRGQTNYTRMIMEEINDGPLTFSSEKANGFLAETLPPQLSQALRNSRDLVTQDQYHSEVLGTGRNTYNWPYDYCSLIELGKISAKVGFRPDLDKEADEYLNSNSKTSAPGISQTVASKSSMSSVPQIIAPVQQLATPVAVKPLPVVKNKNLEINSPKIPYNAPSPPLVTKLKKGSLKTNNSGVTAGYNFLRNI